MNIFKYKFRLILVIFFLLGFFQISAQPFAYTVTNTDDSGEGSLRWALIQADSISTVDTIKFNIPGEGPFTIQPATPLPSVNFSVVIDGYTQPGASPNTQVVGNDAVLLIELDGSLAGPSANGLVFNSGGNTLRGLAVHSFSENGIVLTDSSNLIEGNYFGVDVSGTTEKGNGVDGINMSTNLVVNTLIGGTSPASRNVISANGRNGITLNFASNNLILGNCIGTDASGTIAIGNNEAGIGIFQGANNQIGDTLAAARNIVSANGTNGIELNGGLATGNTVMGNFIGTDASGSAAMGNMQQGLNIFNGASGNFIGGVTAGAGNIISANGADGILIASPNATENTIQGNYIGTDVTGQSALGNTGDGVRIVDASGNLIGGGAPEAANIIAFNGGVGVAVADGEENGILSNFIHSNSGLGIDLFEVEGESEGVTPNDLGDGDFGGNGLQNYPVITFVQSDSGFIAGNFNSTPNMDFTLQFFKNSVCDSTNFGEGETLLATTSLTTDASGNASFAVFVSESLSPEEYVTATATDSSNNTSEFSRCMSAGSNTKIFGENFVVNRTYSGIPLHWMDGNAAYVISNSIPATFIQALVASFDTWSALTQINYTAAGLDTSTRWGGNPDGRNNNVWVPSGWEDLTGTDSTIIALTRVRYNAITGEMTDVDIAYNAQQFTWDVDPQPNSGDMDVQNAITHEVGHFSGLGDIYNPGDPGYFPMMNQGNEEQTMYGLIREEETKKRDLNTGDTNGIQFIYDNLTAVRIDMVIVIDGSSNYISKYNAFGQARKSIVELVSKMRLGDKIGVVRLPSTNVLPLTEIVDEETRSSISETISNMEGGGDGNVGAGLLTGQSQLDLSGEENHRWTMIVLSAAENPSTPGIREAVQTLSAQKTEIFSLGLAGSIGQDSLSYMANETQGGYFLVSDSSEIGNKVDLIWNSLLGRQVLFSDTGSTADLENVPAPGIRWQGALVDAGVTEIQPGIRWQGSDLDLTLEDPDGNFIDSTVAAGDPNIDFVSGPTFEYYTINFPKAGAWDLLVFGADLPPVPEPYSVYVLGSSDLTLLFTLEQDRYQAGETIPIKVSLFSGGQPQFDGHVVGGEPITDAAVELEVTVPGNPVPQLFPMQHIGSGNYSVDFGTTLQEGSYNFTVRAQKPEFQRQASRSAFVFAPFSTGTVLFATNSIYLSEGTEVVSGNVFVNDISPGPVLNANAELSLAENVTTPSGYSLKAHRIHIRQNATIASDVYYNLLGNNGTITGNLFSPLPLPITFLLPPFVSAAPGNTTIVIPANTADTLDAGDYDHVLVETGAQLTLSGGVYNFNYLAAREGASLFFAAPTESRIAEHFLSDSLVYIGPATNANIDAADILFYVQGGNGSDGGLLSRPKAVEIGHKNVAFVNMYAPNGTIWLKYGSEVTGSFIGKDILVSQNVSLILNTAFDSLGTGITAIDDEGDSDDRPFARYPGTFVVSQNFPNPFNPITEIRYQLPKSRHVTITIYDILGQKVATLIDRPQAPGTHTVQWDGKSSNGVSLSSGIYIYRFQAGSVVVSRKMLLVR